MVTNNVVSFEQLGPRILQLANGENLDKAAADDELLHLGLPFWVQWFKTGYIWYIPFILSPC